MGKATIISHDGNGQYTVEMDYDLESLTERISDCDDRIAALDTKISEAEADGDDSKAKILGLYKAAVEKEKARLQSVVDNYTADERSAWCADLTTSLSGEVGTIEPGHDYENGVNIYPGYSDASYDAARDGQVAPLIGQSPAASFFNLATLPGTQKWRPNYRYGTITDLNITADTCDVTLDAVSSRMQELDCNQEATLADVPIEYMNCNASAFAVNDEVIIKFEGFDWESPKVIGFKDNPNSCAPTLIAIKLDRFRDDLPDLYVVWNYDKGAIDTELGLDYPVEYIGDALSSKGWEMSDLDVSAYAQTENHPAIENSSDPNYTDSYVGTYESHDRYTGDPCTCFEYERDGDFSFESSQTGFGDNDLIADAYHKVLQSENASCFCVFGGEEVEPGLYEYVLSPEGTSMSGFAILGAGATQEANGFSLNGETRFPAMRRTFEHQTTEVASPDPDAAQIDYVLSDKIEYKTLFGSTFSEVIPEQTQNFTIFHFGPGANYLGHYCFPSDNYRREGLNISFPAVQEASADIYRGHAIAYEFWRMEFYSLWTDYESEYYDGPVYDTPMYKNSFFRVYHQAGTENGEGEFEFSINGFAQVNMNSVLSLFGGWDDIVDDQYNLEVLMIKEREE